MCKAMVTISTPDGQVQRVWVTLPETTATFQVTVEGAGHISRHAFTGDGHPVPAARVVPLAHRRLRGRLTVPPLGA